MSKELIMEISISGQSMRLVAPPTYKEWFESHAFWWQRKNKRYHLEPGILLCTYNNAVFKHFETQRKRVKQFMKHNKQNERKTL